MLYTNFLKKINKIIRFHRYNPDLGLLPLTNRYLLRQFYKVLKINQTITLANQMKMTVPWFSKFGTEVFLTKSNVDWGSEAVLLKFLDQTKSFIDVGANIGYYSLLASSSSQVLAFEPDPKFVQVLEKNLAPFPNAQVIQEALFSEPGVMKLSLHESGEMNSLVRNTSQSKGIMVKVNTLDHLMLEYPSLKVSCIKTDAEGADLDVLLGGKNLLMRDQPLVLSELYPNVKLLKFLKSIDFSCFGFVRFKEIKNGQVISVSSKPTFMKIEKKITNIRTQMIFLVPHRLLSEFEALVEQLN